WQDDDNANGIYNVYVRGFDSDGNVRFQKSIVNSTDPDVLNATVPTIAMAPDGRFVVAWRSGLKEIKARTYNADGTPATDETVVVTPTNEAGTMNSPDVAMDASGNFVVTWADDTDGNGSFQVRARGYAFNLGVRFNAKTINVNSSGQQVNPAVAMRGNGD